MAIKKIAFDMMDTPNYVKVLGVSVYYNSRNHSMTVEIGDKAYKYGMPERVIYNSDNAAKAAQLAINDYMEWRRSTMVIDYNLVLGIACFNTNNAYVFSAKMVHNV